METHEQTFYSESFTPICQRGPESDNVDLEKKIYRGESGKTRQPTAMSDHREGSEEAEREVERKKRGGVRQSEA